jgi:hypothetical protein
MSDGKHCPACEKDIGIWPVLLAGLPTRVRCPHCKTRLTYGNSLLLVLGVVAMASLVGVASYYITASYLGRNSRLSDPAKFYGVAVVLFLGLWLPVEVAFTLYVRNRGVLKRLD